MATYIYCPEWTEMDQRDTGAWQAARRLNGQSVPEVRASSHSTGNRITDQGALGDLRGGDKLYVLMEGNETIEEVRAIYNNGRECDYSPRALALHLQREGLPRVQLTLKMYSCGSGLSHQEPNGPILQPYAHRLKLELRRLGYTSLSVIGYAGTLLSAQYYQSTRVGERPYGHRVAHWNDAAGRVRTSRASARRVTF